MFKVLLALHLVAAVFAVGPLVAAATTAGRGLRLGDAAGIATSSRLIRVYSYASVLVVLLGFGLMSSKQHGKKVADFSDTWIWLSALLWLVAIVLTLGALVPALDKAGESIGKGEAVQSYTARVAAIGGVVGLIFTGIVFLMVYRPGS